MKQQMTLQGKMEIVEATESDLVALEAELCELYAHLDALIAYGNGTLAKLSQLESLPTLARFFARKSIRELQAEIASLEACHADLTAHIWATENLYEEAELVYFASQQETWGE